MNDTTSIIMAKIWTVPDFVSMVCNVHTDGNYFCDVRGFVGLEYVSSIFSMGVTSGLRNVFGEPVSTTGITQCASKILSLLHWTCQNKAASSYGDCQAI